MDLFLGILSFAIITLAVERAMSVFFANRRTHLAIYLLSYLFLCFSLMLLGWWTVFIYFFALAIVSLNYESTIMKRVAAVTGSHYILLSLTAINSAIARFLPTDWHIDNMGLTTLLTSLLIYFVTWIAFLIFKNIKKTEVNLSKLWLPLIIFPIVYTFIELLYFFIDPVTVGIAINVFNFMGVILIIFYLYNLVSKIIEDNIKSALHSQEKEYYFTQCQFMQESMEKVKSIRHDMKTHLAALKDYTADNKAATDYLNSLLGDIGESEIYSNTGNIAFDSIINFKLKNAKADNITLDLSVAVPPEINVEVADIVTILGNLLDNALEAVAKAAEKMIKLDVEFGKGGLFAKVDNSFNGEVRYLAKQTGADKQIVSLKSGDEHGYGLKNIRQSIEKYDGYMKTTYTENIFSTVVFLYVDTFIKT